MKIRNATKQDADLLARIGAETFWETYHTESHLEQTFIKNHIGATFTIETLASDLSNKNSRYLIAENEDETLGYVRFLFENSRDEISGEKPIEISRIYLRKKFWGKRLGSLLLERCFEEAGNYNCDVIWLSVWKYNDRAIKFYEKFGFEKVGEHIFDLAGSSQIDFLMERKTLQY